ncbi:MAG: pilus assembly protein [Lachnospiraceae bacterium]|nr:pilus assembly protein [Lachnospiraceae bacterium]
MKKEKGAVMVEAVIVFPIVLLTVFALIYLGLFKLQEMAMLYQVQRVAHQGAHVLANPGYRELGDYTQKAIDFSSDPADVNAYYKAAHDNLLVLYREIAGYGAWTSQGELQRFMDKVAESTLILAGGAYADNTVTIDRGLFATQIMAEVTFSFPTPGVMQYFGYPDSLAFKQSAIAVAMDPANFVRMVDLAGDALTVASEKLGIADDIGKIMDGIRKYVF